MCFGSRLGSCLGPRAFKLLDLSLTSLLCAPPPFSLPPHSQERIMELESQAMGAKDWHLTGEADASKRPLNSALEVDMDFDTTGE